MCYHRLRLGRPDTQTLPKPKLTSKKFMFQGSRCVAGDLTGGESPRTMKSKHCTAACCDLNLLTFYQNLPLRIFPTSKCSCTDVPSGLRSSYSGFSDTLLHAEALDDIPYLLRQYTPKWSLIPEGKTQVSNSPGRALSASVGDGGRLLRLEDFEGSSTFRSQTRPKRCMTGAVSSSCVCDAGQRKKRSRFNHCPRSSTEPAESCNALL